MLKTQMLLMVLAVGAGSIGSAAFAAPIFSIDNFQDGVASVSLLADYATTSASTTTATTAAIGGARYAQIDWAQGDFQTRLFINRRGVSQLSFAEDADTHGSVTLQYGTGVSGDLNQDFGVSSNAMRFVFNTADLAGSLTVILTTAGGGSSTVTVATPSGVSNTDTNMDIALSSFTGTANLNDIDAITVKLTGADSGDYIIKGITVVPEPATMALLAAGGLALLRRRKR